MKQWNVCSNNARLAEFVFQIREPGDQNTNLRLKIGKLRLRGRLWPNDGEARAASLCYSPAGLSQLRPAYGLKPGFSIQ